MTFILRHRVVEIDAWRSLEAGEPLPASGPVIVTIERWLAEREALVARADPVGVLVEADARLEPIVQELVGRPLVALRMTRYTDGRSLSSARLLRERHGFRGELRAVGVFLPDQVWELSRCGFDAFAFADASEAGQGLAALGTFTDAYQSSLVEPRPLFRRRPA